MADQLYRISPLVWEKTAGGSYKTSPLKEYALSYLIRMDEGGVFHTYCGQNYLGSGGPLRQAKIRVEAHYRARMAEALEPVTFNDPVVMVEWPDGRVTMEVEVNDR